MIKSDQQNNIEERNSTRSSQNSKPASKHIKNSPQHQRKKIELPFRVITVPLSESASDDQYKKQIQNKVQLDALSSSSQKRSPQKLEIPKQLITDPFMLSQNSINQKKGKKRQNEGKKLSLTYNNKEKSNNATKNKNALSDSENEEDTINVTVKHTESPNPAQNKQNSRIQKSRGVEIPKIVVTSPFSITPSSSAGNKKNNRSPAASPRTQSSEYHSHKSRKSPYYSNRNIDLQIAEQPSNVIQQPIQSQEDSNFTYDYFSVPSDFDGQELKKMVREIKDQKRSNNNQIPRQNIVNREYQAQEQITVESEPFEEEEFFEEEDLFLDEEEEILEGEYYLDDQYEQDESNNYVDNYKNYEDYSENQNQYYSNSINEEKENSNNFYSNEESTPKQYHSHHHSHHQHTHTPIRKVAENYFSASGKKLVRLKKRKGDYYPSPTSAKSPLPPELPPELEPSPKGIETRNKHQFASKVAFSDDDLKERNIAINNNDFNDLAEEEENEANTNYELEENESNSSNILSNNEFNQDELVENGSNPNELYVNDQRGSIDEDDILSFFQVPSDKKFRNNRDTYNFFPIIDKSNHSTNSTFSTNYEETVSSNGSPNSQISKNSDSDHNSGIRNNDSKIESSHNSKRSANNSKIESSHNSQISNNSKISNKSNSKISNNNSRIESQHNSQISNNNSKISNKSNSKVEGSHNSKISHNNSKIESLHNSKISANNSKIESPHNSQINNNNSKISNKSNSKISNKNSKNNSSIINSLKESQQHSQNENIQSRNIVEGADANNSKQNEEIQGIETVTSVYSQTSPRPNQNQLSNASKKNSELSQRSSKIEQNSIHCSSSIKKKRSSATQTLVDQKTQTSVIEEQKQTQNQEQQQQQPQQEEEEKQPSRQSSSSSLISVFDSISDNYRKDVRNYQQNYKYNSKISNKNSLLDRSFSIPYEPPDPRFIKRDVKLEDDDLIDSILSESLSSGPGENATTPTQSPSTPNKYDIYNSKPIDLNSCKSNSIKAEYSENQGSEYYSSKNNSIYENSNKASESNPEDVEALLYFSKSGSNIESEPRQREIEDLIPNTDQQQESQPRATGSSSHRQTSSDSFQFSDRLATASSYANKSDSKFVKKGGSSSSRIDSTNVEDDDANANNSQASISVSQSGSMKSDIYTLNFQEVHPPDIWDKSSGSGIKSKKSSEQSDSLGKLLNTESSSAGPQNGKLAPLQYKTTNSMLNSYNDNEFLNSNSNSNSSDHRKGKSIRNRSLDALGSTSFSVTTNSNINTSEIVNEIDQISDNIRLPENEIGSVIIPSSSTSKNVSMSSESSKSGRERRSHSKQRSSRSHSKANKELNVNLSDVSDISEISSAKNEVTMSDFNAPKINKDNSNINLRNSNLDHKSQNSKISLPTLSNVSSNISSELIDITLESKDSVISDI